VWCCLLLYMEQALHGLEGILRLKGRVYRSLPDPHARGGQGKPSIIQERCTFTVSLNGVQTYTDRVHMSILRFIANRLSV
jgi:hypothetical protein